MEREMIKYGIVEGEDEEHEVKTASDELAEAASSNKQDESNSN